MIPAPIAPLVLLAATLAPVEDPAPRAPQGGVTAQGVVPTRLEAEVQVAGADAAQFTLGPQGSAGMNVFSLPTEGRGGVSTVLGGFGRTPGPAEKEGLSFLFFLHLYEDGGHFLEGQILNDAMERPPGLVEATYRVVYDGEVVAEGTSQFHDECGVFFSHGEPRFAPRQDLLDKYLATMPPLDSLGPVPTGDAEPKEDPDPTPNTHQAGSPRNRYWALEGAKYLATQDARYLERLIDFVGAQARRPYHLSRTDGEPFQAARHPDAHFLEGRPEMKAYRDTFGRLLLPSAALAGDGHNGWDHEHMNVEELYAAYVLVGSRVARRDLVLIAEELLTTPYVKEEKKHQSSSRAFGWVARMLVRAYQATGHQRYLDAVRRMIRSLDAHRIADAPYKALVAQEPRADHMAKERYESPFMVAIAASALALYLREEPTDQLAKEILVFCGDLLVEQGWSPSGGGFYYDYSVETSARSGDGRSTNGVVLFIVSPLVDVADHVPEGRRAKYLDPARAVFEANVRDGWAKPDSEHYWKWFLRAAREFGKTSG